MGETLEKRVLAEVRMLTRERVLEKALSDEMTWKQAAGVLGLSSRQLRRIRQRYLKSGAAGLRDRRAGNRRQKRVSEKLKKRLVKLKQNKYENYSVRHFHDVVCGDAGPSYEWTLRMLQEEGVVEKVVRRGTYRRRRPRQPMVGMRVHTDGSTHPWLGPDHPTCDLVIMLDDADGRLLAARFVPEESVLSTMALLEEVLCKYGRFGELYHDRGSMYCQTSDATVGPDAEQSGQVPRALEALGIRQIWAYSPQARGRCERAFGTIQGRLCPELETAGITDYTAADAYLQDVFIKDFNRRFTVKPTQPESAFVSVGIRKRDRQLLLSTHRQRVVRNDYTVAFQRHTLQLEKPKDRRVLVGRKVIVHELTDGRLAITHQGALLAYFESHKPWHQYPQRQQHGPILPPKPPPRTLQQALKEHPDDPIIRRTDMFSTAW